MEHTPGPWRSQWSETLGITGYDILGPDDVAIAGICDMVGSPLPLEANAKLIASAPSLLEALEELTEYSHDWHEADGSPILGLEAANRMARDAIKKAKGPAQ